MTTTQADPAAPAPAATDKPADPLAAANAARKANAEAKKRGERGPDKRPRKRREDRKAGGGGAPKKAANPLNAAVDGEGAPDAPPSGGQRGKLGAPSGGATSRKGTAQELIALSSTELASLAVRLGSAMILKAGAKRYGENAVLLALDEGEEKEITRLGEKVLDKYLIRLEPEWALAITVGVIYAQKIMTAEAAKDAGVDAATMRAAMAAAMQKQIAEAKEKAAAMNGDASTVGSPPPQ